jgi:hypothetical protein
MIEKGIDHIPTVAEQTTEDMEIDDSASTDSMPPLVPCCDPPIAAPEETVATNETETGVLRIERD